MKFYEVLERDRTDGTNPAESITKSSTRSQYPHSTSSELISMEYKGPDMASGRITSSLKNVSDAYSPSSLSQPLKKAGIGKGDATARTPGTRVQKTVNKPITLTGDTRSNPHHALLTSMNDLKVSESYDGKPCREQFVTIETFNGFWNYSLDIQAKSEITYKGRNGPEKPLGHSKQRIGLGRMHIREKVGILDLS